MSAVISIRPHAGGEDTVKHGALRNLAITSFPMSHAVPCDWSGPDPSTVDALLLGSGRAIVLGGPELARYRSKPVYAVGRTTAQMAEKAGFVVQSTGAGGLQQVLDGIDLSPLTLLRLAGSRQVEVEPPQGITIITREVYAIEDLPMPAAMAEVLVDGSLVLLHSAGAAEHLRAECERLGIDRSRIRLAALGPRIAEAAGSGWGDVRWADRPTDAALLALAADMCH